MKWLLAAMLAAPFAARADRTYRWTFPEKPSAEEARSVRDDFEKLLEHTSAGAKLPMALRQSLMAWVDFGIAPGDRASGQPFLWPGGESGFLCTTKEPAYDALVQASLLAVRDHFPPERMAVSSTVQWPDWADGAALYEKALGRAARDPGLKKRVSALTLGALVIAAVLLFALIRAARSTSKRMAR